MTPQQIDLVRDSFGQVQSIAREAAGLFYTNLFEADPALRALFRGDLVEQGRRLFDMIGAGVSMLDRPAQLVPVLRKLGGLHVAYGVLDEHYETVGRVLTRTLAQGLGAAFTADVENAWRAFHAMVSATMREGAAEATLLAAA